VPRPAPSGSSQRGFGAALPDASPPPDLAKRVETVRRAVEQAQEFTDVETVLERHKDTASLPAAEREVQRRLKDTSLSTGLRGQLIMLERLFAETREHGTRSAVTRYGVRAVAAGAWSAKTPEQFVQWLNRFPELPARVDDTLVRETLDTTAIPWPEGARPVVEQLFRDWKSSGAVEASRRLAEWVRQAQQGSGQKSSGSDSGATGDGAERRDLLVGHWTCQSGNTSAQVSMISTYHIVFDKNGTYRTWTGTFTGGTDLSSRDQQSGVRSGRWELSDRYLTLTGSDGQTSGSKLSVDGSGLLMHDWNSRRLWERAK
jgi:hypothetical protein